MATRLRQRRLGALTLPRPTQYHEPISTYPPAGLTALNSIERQFGMRTEDRRLQYCPDKSRGEYIFKVSVNIHFLKISGLLWKAEEMQVWKKKLCRANLGFTRQRKNAYIEVPHCKGRGLNLGLICNRNSFLNICVLLVFLFCFFL